MNGQDIFPKKTIPQPRKNYKQKGLEPGGSSLSSGLQGYRNSPGPLFGIPAASSKKKTTIETKRIMIDLENVGDPERSSR